MRFMSWRKKTLESMSPAPNTEMKTFSIYKNGEPVLSINAATGNWLTVLVMAEMLLGFVFGPSDSVVIFES